MANFLSGLVGNKGIAKVVGEKAGDFVEDTVNKVLSGKDSKAQAGAGQNAKGGFDVGDVLSFGDKKEEKGGFDMGDVLSFGDKKEEKGGFDMGDVLSFGDKKEEKGGLDMGDALSLIGGSKDKGDGGLDVSGAIDSFLK